ncbi:right-handed parallel beta-helix repeat-containing protein [bacterium]|nr:right-handed parallel beta-helix repeat-containing protein [bacterium]
MNRIAFLNLLLMLCTTLAAREYHVSVRGSDANEGSPARPLKTIQAAALRALPGDTITVHAGTYRERVNPVRGGESDHRRIVYRAAPGETVHLKGSEIVSEWTRVKGGVWKKILANSFFGDYNPYKDLIYGDWFSDHGRPHHTGEVFLNGKSLYEVESLDKVMNPAPLADAQDQEGSTYVWYCTSDDAQTTLWVNFHRHQPNKELVEITTRPCCFYPEKTGIHYLTIRGFHMSQAATQWAPPTAEQPGLIGANWSKGWIIEHNVISNSKCSGITLGKDRSTGQNAWLADPSKDGSQHYNETIFKALRAGWNRENIGSHIVRNNTIYNCEQTGLCGSLGAVFSQIYGNHIYNIWTKRQFGGAELAGIKIHASIDVVIRNNRIHNTCRGLWMDWMAQGTQILANLLYDNYSEDLFLEVNHGPYLVCNNMMLSPRAIFNMSQGGAFVHNLITGRIFVRPEPNRFTPYHFPHSTDVAGLITILNGDDRYFNNLFASDSSCDKKVLAPNRQTPAHFLKYTFGLQQYATAQWPVRTASNLYLNGYQPYGQETNSVMNSSLNPAIRLEDKGEEVYLHLSTDSSFQKIKTQLVTSILLGRAKMADAAWENPDGSSLTIDWDYFAKPRSSTSPRVGPFENVVLGEQTIRIW